MTRFSIPLMLLLSASALSSYADDPAARFAAMTPDEVRAFQNEVNQKIKTTEGIEAMELIADLALIPPTMNTSPLPEYGYDRLDYGMTIGIERTPGGRLWACWVAGGDSPKAFFLLATSDDDGATWSPPRLVVDAHGKDLPRDRSVLVGNLWTDPLGRLWLIFDQSIDMFDGRAGVWVSICENPDAQEPAWSKPRRIWHGVTLNKPTVLSTGEWMMPISLDQRGGFGPFKGAFQELDPYRGANVFVSTDQGTTWQRRGCVQLPNPDWHEHMIVERTDGSLWMLARTGKGIMESTSSDGGRTWSRPALSDIKHPVARFHIRRLASNRILLVKHGETIDSHEGRSKLTAWLSEDEGKTWQGGLMLDERKGISYPDGFQAPDGTIYISYDRNRATDGEILMARFTEDDVLARKLVGRKSKLKMLISRPLAGKVTQPVTEEPSSGRIRLWTGARIPGDVEQIPFVPGVEHRTIHRATADGFKFLHGAAIVQHKGVFYANWANSPTNENGPHETLQGRRSNDGGKTWSDIEVIGPGFDGPERHSHGVLFVHKDQVWTICSRFGVGTPGRHFRGLGAEAFVLNDQTDRWESRGVVMEDCWPYDEPVRMADGNLITGGQDKDGLPVVAISRGDDLLKWDTIPIPFDPRLGPSYAETTVWAEGSHVIAVIRGGRGVAWVSTSDDCGRTWSKAAASNFPMPRAKAYLGKLSTGQLYLLSNLKSRDTLVISVSEPGELTLSRIWRIRHGKSGPPRFPGGAKSKQWSYPYGYEHNGKLYVVYSIGKEDCGLSVLPIESLRP